MEAETLAAAKRVIILVVVVALVLAMTAVVMIAFEAIKGETETVGAAGFTVRLGQPAMNCTPDGWLIDFGKFNITDPQRRSMRIIPLHRFAGRYLDYIGHARRQSDMDAAPAIGGRTPGLVVLDGGKGSTSSLQFGMNDFIKGVAFPMPPDADVGVDIGLWMWSGCISDALVSEAASRGLSGLLEYTASHCPDTYIGMLHRTVKTKAC